MSELGSLALLFTLLFSSFAGVAGILGGSLVRPRLGRAAERALLAAFATTLLAALAMVAALVRSDFSLEYVWGHSNRDLPIFYKVTSLWSGQEGSLLLWELVILAYGAAAVLLHRRRDRLLMPWVTATIGLSAAFFALLNVFVAPPFNTIALVGPDGGVAALPSPPPDGRGLNPILQHPVMAIHPPVLYAGYVGFVVPFAFCIAALVTGQLHDTWIRSTRRWTLVAWGFLGCGILLGARWAYVELGWGGYWGWDPVENASLLPWLIGTAFLHSVMIQEKKGMLKVWNVVLVLLTYVLAIFGTFTTRSGIMSSVHSFAESPIGAWFVGYLIVLTVVTAVLLFIRLPELRSEARYESMVSREASFLFNNLVFLAATFAVFYGTMWPVVSEWLSGEKQSIAAPWFNRIMAPLGLLLLFLMGVGPLLAWRKTSPKSLWRNFAWPAGGGLLTAAALGLAGVRELAAIVSFALCVFVTVTIVGEFWHGARARARSLGVGVGAGLIDLVQRNTRRYGGYVVHFAIVLLFVGFTGKAFETETKVPVREGDTVSIRGYDLRAEKLVEDDRSNPNYSASRLVLRLEREGRFLARLEPETRFYPASEQQTTEVGRWSGLREDVYATLVRGGPDAPAEVQVFVNPLVRWVWLGGLLMAAGTLITLAPDRRGGRPGAGSGAAVASPAEAEAKASR